MPHAAVPCAFSGAYGCQPRCLSAPVPPGDDQLLTLLVTAWALDTGRIPPTRPPEQLTAAELIDFWADDQTATGNPPALPE